LQYKYTVLTNTTIGAFMAQLDANIVLISLPTIIRDLPNTSTVDGIWIIMGYILISATLLLTIGRLGDVFGRVRLYNAGFAIFTIGSGLCSVSPNGLSLVLFRLVQGVGGALIFANNAALLTDAFDVTERGRAIGINQVAGVSGSVLGLVAGGALTEALGWRSIFWINLPVGAFATVWAYARLKELGTLSKNRKLDPLGNLLFALGLSLFLLGMSLGAITGWSPTEIYVMAAGLLLVIGFVIVETKVPSPMMDLSLFRIRAFSAGIFSNLLSSLARGGISLVLVFYFQGALLLDALTAGVLLIPFSLAFVAAGPLSGYLSDRYGARGFSTGGLLLSAAAMFVFSLLPAHVSYEVMVIPMVMAGVGGGMFVAPNISSVMSSVPMARRGVASGMASMLVSTGFLLSLGMCFAIMATTMPLSVLQAIFAGLPVSSGSVDLGLFVVSMHEIFLVMAVLSLVAALTSSLRGPKPIS
jgi:EmrB/QacA subfamily drug resistance transporter